MSIFDEGREKTAAVVVAHPDDETLWAGGMILGYPAWNWYIATLCRASDEDRAPKFQQALRELGAAGAMADLDDGPAQLPLSEEQVGAAILGLLPPARFSVILTHDPSGEYTRHLRHEETGRAVIQLWQAGKIEADELWTFAYEDGQKSYLPQAIDGAPVRLHLAEDVWQRKYEIITGTYGFPVDGFEAKTTPRTEAFWRFTDPEEAQAWAEMGGWRA